MNSNHDSPNLFDAQLSKDVTYFLEFALSMAISRDEVGDVYAKNSDHFSKLQEEDKQRLRAKWREAMEKFK